MRLRMSVSNQKPKHVRSPEDDPWLFTAEELENSLSCHAGIPKDVKDKFYLRAPLYIHECAGVKRLPALTISVAGTFLRHFFMLESVTSQSMAYVASECLFLACKVSETHKRLRNMIHQTAAMRCVVHRTLVLLIWWLKGR